MQTGIAQTVAMFSYQEVSGNGEVHIPMIDHMGNIRHYYQIKTTAGAGPSASTVTGQITANLDYDAFGREVRATGPKTPASGQPPGLSPNDPWVDNLPFHFSTKFTDRESGLNYYGYRFYDPIDGRWLNRDPIEEAGGINLYSAARNVFVNSHDLLGLEECCITGIELIDKGKESAQQRPNVRQYPGLARGTILGPTSHSLGKIGYAFEIKPLFSTAPNCPCNVAQVYDGALSGDDITSNPEHSVLDGRNWTSEELPTDGDGRPIFGDDPTMVPGPNYKKQRKFVTCFIRDIDGCKNKRCCVQFRLELVFDRDSNPQSQTLTKIGSWCDTHNCPGGS